MITSHIKLQNGTKLQPEAEKQEKGTEMFVFNGIFVVCSDNFPLFTIKL